MNANDLSKDGKSTLLYFETCAVDQGGRVDMRKMNQPDREAADGMKLAGVIKFERVPAALIEGHSTYYVELTPLGWEMAHQLRRERSERVGAISKIRSALVEMGKLEV